jgi:hypothetical protein
LQTFASKNIMNDYLTLIEKLLSDNKTTGPNQSEFYVNYTKLNLQRMQRWLKTAQLSTETVDVISSIKTKQHWVILTEAWCGDAAHSLPIIYKMSALNPLIQFEWKLRDENEALMNKYLTNGGKSIPKLIVHNDKGEELFNWGPRPAELQEIYLQLKKEEKSFDDINLVLQKFYNDDKGQRVQKEICNLLSGTKSI